MQFTVSDSPVYKAVKEGPRGDGNWPGFDSVWSKISSACFEMAKDRRIRLSDDHIETMGDLGSGHEERMKWRQMWLRTYGWIK